MWPAGHRLNRPGIEALSHYLDKCSVNKSPEDVFPPKEFLLTLSEIILSITSSDTQANTTFKLVVHQWEAPLLHHMRALSWDCGKKNLSLIPPTLSHLKWLFSKVC